jgi:hypothetical protein
MNESKPAPLKSLALVVACLIATSMSQAAFAQSLPGGGSGPQIIFDNTSTYLNRFVAFGDGEEFGDQIFFQPGVARFITDFKFQYFGSANLNSGTGEFFVYLNDGSSVATVGGESVLAPNTPLFRSGSFDLSPGFQTVDLDLSGSPVAIRDTTGAFANTLTWTVVFSGINPGAQAGLTVFSPATEGASFDDFWRKTSTGWDTLLIDNGAIPGNFAAQVTAVPEPGTLVFGLLGGLGVMGLARFRRR